MEDFRRLPHIGCVVENTPPEFVPNLLRPVLSSCPQLLDKEILAMHESIGSPRVDDEHKVSGTTARYIEYIAMTKCIFGNEWLQGKTVYEVGAGYGGLCHLLVKLCGVGHYTLCDAPAPLGLQRRFLEKLGLATEVDYTSQPSNSGFDLAVSTCGLHEATMQSVAMHLPAIKESKHLFFVGGEGKLYSTLEREGIKVKKADRTVKRFYDLFGERFVYWS